MAPVTLRTARLVLSVPTTDDIDAITEAAQDPEVPRWTTLPSPYARADAEQFIANAAEWWDAETELTWGIRADGRWVGMIGLHRIRTRRVRRDRLLDGRARARPRVPHRGGTRSDRLRIRARRARASSASTGVRSWATSPRRAPRGPSASATRGSSARSSSTRERDDGWIAGLLVTDDRTPQPWPVLDA